MSLWRINLHTPPLGVPIRNSVEARPRAVKARPEPLKPEAFKQGLTDYILRAQEKRDKQMGPAPGFWAGISAGIPAGITTGIKAGICIYICI